MAFGTGLHPSTRLCLLGLESHLRSGDRVLDLGTGSGILAIAAAKLGASEVLALDIDPMAVASARENVQRNGVSGVVDVIQGSLAEAKTRRGSGFDLVVVNILAEVILQLLEEGLVEAVCPHGRLIVGGIIATRVPEVLREMTCQGLEIVGQRQEEDWFTYVARRVG
jgi:ribosomal protein L11 methyltransferase